MSQIYQRYLPPEPNGLPVTSPHDVWRSGRALITSVRFQFILLVLTPTFTATIYYGLIATPQYVSHAEYIVRGVDAHRSSGLAALLNTFGVSRAADETSAIESFLKSRDAVEKIDSQVGLREVYGTSGADVFSRFPRFWESNSFEALYAFTRSFLNVTKDSATGVTTLEVAAFDPRSAKLIADAMLASAAEMANNLNSRAEVDMVAAANDQLETARNEVVKTQSELTDYRNSILLVDPLAFAGAMLQDIGALSLERARMETEIAQTKRLSPDNPAINSLKASAEALSHKVDEERGKLAGDSSALASKVAAYERLTLLRELADKRYAQALVSLQSAQNEAQRKRIYIEEVVTPNQPDEPTRPERLRAILSIFVLGFIAFSILWILSVGSKDHAQ